MNPNSKEFKDLQSTWYKKLSKEGFDDIEQADGNLKMCHGSWFQAKYSPAAFDAKQTYYRMAVAFLHDYELAPLDKSIWELYANGMPVLDILTRVKAEGFKTHRNFVYARVRELSKIMLQFYKDKARRDDTE